jgi:hypothetical protein
VTRRSSGCASSAWLSAGSQLRRLKERKEISTCVGSQTLDRVCSGGATASASRARTSHEP